MKHTFIFIALLATQLAFGLAEDPSEIARQRDEQVNREAQDLKNLDAQIVEFESSLAGRAEVECGTCRRRNTNLLAEGKKLATDAHSMMAKDKAYGVDVKQQHAECPENTTDAALAQRCREWKAKLDNDQKEIKAITKDWTERKDKSSRANQVGPGNGCQQKGHRSLQLLNPQHENPTRPHPQGSMGN